MRYQCRRRCTFSECRQASELISLNVRCCPELELIRTNFRDAHRTPAELASMSVRPIFFWARAFGVRRGEKGVLGPLISVRYDSRRTTDKAILLNQRGKRDGQEGSRLTKTQELISKTKEVKHQKGEAQKDGVETLQSEKCRTKASLTLPLTWCYKQGPTCQEKESTDQQIPSQARRSNSCHRNKFARSLDAFEIGFWGWKMLQVRGGL